MTAVLPSMVRSYHVGTGDGIDGLSLRKHEPRTPGEGEVAVAVHATSLSFRELLVLRGHYVLPVKPDVIPVSDGAGEVVAVGPDVRRVRPGDRVTATLFPRWLDGPLERAYLPQLGGSLDGMLTELAILPEDALVPIPDHLSYAEARRNREHEPEREGPPPTLLKHAHSTIHRGPSVPPAPAAAPAYPGAEAHGRAGRPGRAGARQRHRATSAGGHREWMHSRRFNRLPVTRVERCRLGPGAGPARPNVSDRKPYTVTR